MSAVSLHNVSKKFRDPRGREVRAADNVSLEVAEGEFLVLVGPSGCGKSTLLRLIAGLETLDNGSISISDRVVNDFPPADREVAMVFQNYALFPHLTVYENMAFGLQFRKITNRETKQRVQAAAQLLKLEDLLERKPIALSGGQRQRVALGRAIVREPKVFLLDEPLSNLDAQLRAETRAELARLHRRLGATMILVTHDQTEAMTLGQRLCIMNGGKVVQTGTPLEIYQQPKSAFVAGFLGSPGMNLIRGIVHAGGRELLVAVKGSEERLRVDIGWELAIKVMPYVGKDMVIGFRPEHVLLGANIGTGGRSWEATMDLCEPLGHENLLHFTYQGVPFTARAPVESMFAPGQVMPVRIPADRAMVFDGVSGEVMVERMAGPGV
ncbi:MAG TPA: sn-glycerol-3-phosphate ABC transporter ATP-binding protein UgpC [Verrucomicrobiae bacterium]